MPPNHLGPRGGHSFVCRLRAHSVPSDEFSLEAASRLFADQRSQYRLRALLEGLVSLTARPALMIDAAEHGSDPGPFLDPEEGGVRDGE